MNGRFYAASTHCLVGKDRLPRPTVVEQASKRVAKH